MIQPPIDILFITFPKGSTTTLVMIAAIALLFGGIAKIAEGFRKKELKTWQKWSSFCVVGALTVAVANTIFVVTGFWDRSSWSNIWNCPYHNGHSDDILRNY